MLFYVSYSFFTFIFHRYCKISVFPQLLNLNQSPVVKMKEARTLLKLLHRLLLHLKMYVVELSLDSVFTNAS